jgi:general secretion pathway protein D
MKRYILPLLIVPSIAFPQMDGEDMEDGEMGAPPPPPSITSSDSAGSSDKANTSDGPMSKIKKDKLAMASPDEINDKNFPELIDSFDYNNAEITDVIKAISELTGKNFIIDPAVRGKITIIAPTKISVAEAYRAFLSALAINGYTVVPSGGFLKVKSSRNAQRDNIDTYSGTYFPNSDQMITRIIHLKHISAEQVSRELRILNSKDGELSPYPQTNSLILSDYGSNIERVMKIINQLDVPGFEEKLVVIPIKYAKAKDMAELVNKIVNKDSSSKGGPVSAGMPRFGGPRPTQGGSGSAYFMVIPDDRTNALIVVGNTPGIDRIRKLLSQLDFKIRLDENGGVYVYYVKNGEAEKIAQTLNGIAKENKPSSSSGGGTSGAPPMGPAGVAQSTEIFGGDVKIAADKETNSLIVTASKQDYEVVLNLLSKIDIPRDQVYVEAIIMEMILEDSAKWGVGYFKYDAESKGVGRMGFNGLGSDLQAMMNPTGGEGAILAFGSKGTVPVTIGGTTTNIPDLVGFINFIKGIGRTNILSTPQIMALDNEDAEIEVGDEVATSLQTSTGANGVTQTSATFKDATLKLKIKPFISPAADTIRMKIEQKIAQPKAKGEIPNTLTIAKRSITTNIVVPDGDTAVLGGLVKDEEQESVTKVPILGDIPILGWLFKSRKITKNKANLLVFITPKIIRNIEDNSKLLGKKLDQRLNFIKQNGGRDPYGKVVDDLPRRQASTSNHGVRDSSEPIRSKSKVDSQPTIDTNSESDIKVESDLKSEDRNQSEDGTVVE